MQNGFLFDNIYIGHSEKDAAQLAEETWVIKSKLEKAAEPKAEEPAPGDSIVDKAKGYAEQAKSFAFSVKASVEDFILLAKEDFVGAVKELPHIAGLLVIAAILPLLFISSLFSAPAKKPVVSASKKEGGEKSDKKGEVAASATGVEKTAATKRAAKSTD
jgi:calnexin